ncbi:hypothetical protein YC2023_076657 [Brassica napus]
MRFSEIPSVEVYLGASQIFSGMSELPGLSKKNSTDLSITYKKIAFFRNWIPKWAPQSSLARTGKPRRFEPSGGHWAITINNGKQNTAMINALK